MTVLPISLYFIKVMSDFLIIRLIDFSLRSWWWMVIFVQSAVIGFHRSRCIKTVMIERGELFLFFSLFSALHCLFFSCFSLSIPHAHILSVQCVCCSFSSWFGHWFLLEYISVWFKFSWEMHDPTAACRRCLASTGILLASLFHCLSLYSHLAHLISLLPFSSC